MNKKYIVLIQIDIDDPVNRKLDGTGQSIHFVALKAKNKCDNGL